MGLKVAIQMDPIGGINPLGDSTLRLGAEAQGRGHELFYYTPDTLSLRGNDVTAHARRLHLSLDPKHYYDFVDAPQTLDLRKMDVVLLRQDPPFNMHYITTTYMLERLQPDVLVANDPASVRNHSEKLFPFEFAEFMPPTLISGDITEIVKFRAEYKDIIIKPLYGYGGKAVLRVKPDDDNFDALLEMQFSASREPVVVQAFLPEVKTGDRRIILIDGKFAGAIGRIPAEHEIRANMRVGGTPTKVELTKKQNDICAALEKPLRERGFIFAGVDVIGDYLTEINITSPTGLAAVEKLYGKNLAADFGRA